MKGDHQKKRYKRKYIIAIPFILAAGSIAIYLIKAKTDRSHHISESFNAAVTYLLKADIEAAVMNQPARPVIVVLGDSIFGFDRDETSITGQLAKSLSATVYNCAVPGTSAALRTEKTEEYDMWNAYSLCCLIDVIIKEDYRVLFTYSVQKEVVQLISGIDYDNVDYFVIAYGLNDYFSGVPARLTPENPLYSYEGALLYAVEQLQSRYSNARILLMSPTFCQFYSYGKVVDTGDTKDMGGGLETEYVEAAREVAMGAGILYMDNYRGLGIYNENGSRYLSDAVHLNELGRAKLAKKMTYFFKRDLMKSRFFS